MHVNYDVRFRHCWCRALFRPSDDVLPCFAVDEARKAGVHGVADSKLLSPLRDTSPVQHAAPQVRLEMSPALHCVSLSARVPRHTAKHTRGVMPCVHHLSVGTYKHTHQPHACMCNFMQQQSRSMYATHTGGAAAAASQQAPSTPASSRR